MQRVLVAGLGNIFRGDDAFGVEMAARLTGRPRPRSVDVVDFGIRSLDLTYALLDDYDAALLIDVTSRGGPPGTIYVIEPELTSVHRHADLSAHEIDPAKVLATVAAMDGRCRRVVIVGCEPETFGGEFEGCMGLSEPVAAAIERAIPIVEEWMDELAAGQAVAEV